MAGIGYVPLQRLFIPFSYRNVALFECVPQAGIPQLRKHSGRLCSSVLCRTTHLTELCHKRKFRTGISRICMRICMHVCEGEL